MDATERLNDPDLKCTATYIGLKPKAGGRISTCLSSRLCELDLSIQNVGDSGLRERQQRRLGLSSYNIEH